MLTVLLVILILALIFGGWGVPRYGYAGLSPLAIVVIVILILWAMGAL